MKYFLTSNGVVTSGNALNLSQSSLLSSSGGGKRSAITGFSSASARRLRDVLCRFRGRGLPYAFTFTFPYDLTPEEFRIFWRRFVMRLSRLSVPMIWRVELTKRKRPHVHAVIYSDDVIKCFLVQESWWDVVGAYPYDAAIFYSCVFRTVSGVRWWRYVASHATKRKESQLGWLGRQWGVVNRRLLTDTSFAVPCISDSAFYRVLRVLRRLSRCRYSRGFFGESVWFCSPDTVKRLLSWSGSV